MSIIVGAFHLSPELFRTNQICANSLYRTNVTRAAVAAVYRITVHEVDRIKEHADEIQPYLIEPYDFDTWDISHAADIGTPLLNENKPGRAMLVFARRTACALCTRLHWTRECRSLAIKPFFCLFFPLTLIDLDVNVTEIGVDGKAYETCLVPGESEGYLFRQFEQELKRVIGEAHYWELEQRYPE